MQTLNVLDNQSTSFNVFNSFSNDRRKSNNNNASLLEQLQTTLDLNKILDIFAMEAARYINFSGLYFKNQTISKALPGIKKAKQER